MSNLKKLTILHSNDMHGDFDAEQIDKTLVGGVSMLSGYINKVRSEEENVIYAIAGDMFRGSIIDTEFRGMSTIQIMNLLAPDIVTVGNHEIDYGLAHLLFLEKCADFPIVNANMRLSTNHKRLFEPCKIIEIDGMKILFIGIITEIAAVACKLDPLIGTFISLEEAADEIGRICNTYNSIDVDLTVLLTHIGIKEDKKLAEILNPDWGVDLIIGGHSHTYMTEPVIVNGIPIVQAGTGTDQIGRFDILIDSEQNCVDSYKWKPIPINSENCPRDYDIERLIETYQTQTEEKYGKILTKFVRQYTHPSRYQETELGDLFADIMKEALGVDIFLLGSGSIREEVLGPIVTKGDFKVCFPYDDPVHVVWWTGEQLKHGFMRVLRDEALAGAHTEFYQLSKGLLVEYDQKTHEFIRFEFEGKPIEDNKLYSIGLEHYHYQNIEDSFDLKLSDVQKNHKDKVASTSSAQVIEEILIKKSHQCVQFTGRLIIHKK